MKPGLSPLLIPLILLCTAPQAFGNDEPLSCADRSVTASAVRTTEDVRAFVQCAYEFVQEVGFTEARRAFNEDERWKSGPIYIFVSEATPVSDQARLFVFPPARSREGSSLGLLIDAFGNDYYKEQHRIVSSFSAGWLYYSFTNPVTGRDEPKYSYIKRIDWEGNLAAIGAGIYRRDIPGTCEGQEVNAPGLEAAPSNERLQEFVRCAAMELESQGYFATRALSSDPRWSSRSIYVFGLDIYGNTLFSGDPYSQWYGLIAPELNDHLDGPFGGRDVVSVGDAFGETFLYYSTRNPSTGMMQRKVTFVKRVVVYGLPVLIGAGYYPDEGVQPGSAGEDNGSNDSAELPTGNDSGSAGQGGSATLLYWQAPTILNPYLSSGTKDAEAASLVIEPLAEYNPNGEIVAVLATRVPTLENGGVSDDRTRITWNIREDVVWSDGTPLTANDVVFTWRYCTAPGGGCAVASSFENVASVDAVDERTITITFDGPTSFPYSPFVSHLSPILQASQFADCLGAAATDCTDANFGPIGTGPYVVADFRTNDTVLYQLNPLYRGVESGLPSFAEVILKGGGTAAAAARSVLQLNQADYAWNLQVEPEILASLSAGGGGTIVSAFSTLVERLMINQTNSDASLGDLRSEYADGTNPHPFLTDPVVGRALSLAIDRDTLVRTGYGGHAGQATCNVWPAPPAASTNNDECLVQNISLAIEILNDAGIVDSDGDGVREREGVPLKILFQTSTNSVRQTTQELIKGWWAELGVETELKNINPAVFFGGDPDSPDTLGRFYADVQMYAAGGVDPESYLGSWLTDQIAGAANSFHGRNVQRFQSDKYDRLHDELHNTVDMEQRNQITIALNDLLVGSYSLIPLIHRGNVSAHSNDIEGVWMNAWDSELWNFETWTRRN